MVKIAYVPTSPPSTVQVQEERRKAKDGEVQRREEARRVAAATQATFEARQAADRGGRAAFEEPPGGSMVELPAELQVSHGTTDRWAMLFPQAPASLAVCKACERLCSRM